MADRVLTSTAAGVYIPRTDGKVLLVHHARSNTWVVPGGKGEKETPWQCADREAREELGIPVAIARLLTVHHVTGRKPLYRGAEMNPGAYPCHIFTFLGSLHPGDEHQIKLPADELLAWTWYDPQEAANTPGLMEETNAANLLACHKAWAAGDGGAYLEDGLAL
ncbi:hypothetical protein GCM10010193_57280 [Kitasatospora atroaurantiaca]|uniref:ADP-ribose pyrophosphatase YjhB (NUDIX family) n=1 Tax=Kitasatospora atroaurantiaca TaxID=285545 RepID=A0A561EMX6_9ACTN|nr:NUDIX hydrolase [Kitasatospora atroaurantiaca]TWE16976.1 ADP-ribose pyrophosphatase YjhB (NUDIX family) [Kitasatospora atroaurantiaca]